MSRTVRFSVSIPNNLLREFDRLASKLALDRSKAIRMAMRNMLAEYKWIERMAERVAGVLVLQYAFEEFRGKAPVLKLQHQYHDIIISTMHIHLDEENCMEALALRGDTRRVKEFIDKVHSLKGLKQMRLTLIELE